MSGAEGPKRARARRRRADYGSIRFRELDAALLGLIAEQYTISVQQLARLNGTSFPVAIRRRNRWRRAGWVESRQILWPGPSFIWLSREGTRVVESPFRALRPNPGRVAHLAAVTDVRLLLERELGLGRWVCERALAKAAWSPGRRLPHLPDAVLETARGRIAIEVELTLKGTARLELILAELASRYPEVWYFAAPRVAPTLRRLAAATPWRNVVVRPFPPLAEDFRS